MKLFHACLGIEVLLMHHALLPTEKLNVMLSYGIEARTEDFTITHRDKIDGLIGDSGTYTSNNQAASTDSSITLEGYIPYARLLHPHLDFYLSFDRGFGYDSFEDNLEQQKKLEAAGLDPVPVIHNLYGEEVDYYIEHYERIAIGSNEIETYDSLWPVVDLIHNAGVKIHLLGTTRWDLLSRLPVDSCDSSNANQIGKYGEIAWWNPHKLGKNKTDYVDLNERLKPPKKGGYNIATYPFRKELKDYLKETLGIDDSHLLGYGNETYKRLVNVRYLVELEKAVNEEHRRLGYQTW